MYQFAGSTQADGQVRNHHHGLPTGDSDATAAELPKGKGCRYWPWRLLKARTFGLPTIACTDCGGELALRTLITDTLVRWQMMEQRARQMHVGHVHPGAAVVDPQRASFGLHPDLAGEAPHVVGTREISVLQRIGNLGRQ